MSVVVLKKENKSHMPSSEMYGHSDSPERPSQDWVSQNGFLRFS